MRIAGLLAVTLMIALTGCKKEETPAATGPSLPTISESDAPSVMVASFENRSLEVGCGKCIYEMPGVDDCTPAVKINGVPFLLTGVDLAAHDEGLCEAAKTAVVSGKVEDGKFVATDVSIE